MGRWFKRFHSSVRVLVADLGTHPQVVLPTW
jgi:hypothetical protein